MCEQKKATLFGKASALYERLFFEDCLDIDGEAYYEETTIVNDAGQYVLLRSMDAPSHVRLCRISRYYEKIEDETELRNALDDIKKQRSRTAKGKKLCRLLLDIVIALAAIAAILGNAWFICNDGMNTQKHELVCYGLLAACFCMVNHHIRPIRSPVRLLLFIVGFAALYTAFVCLLNNWWTYLDVNSYISFDSASTRYWPYSNILETDILYNVGIGAFRYWIVFFAAMLGLLVDTVVIRWLAALRRRVR